MSTLPGLRALPIYLGPVLPRWQPRSINDVQQAINDGSLRKRHWLDAKAEVGTTDSGRKGLAKDLASFANDGGGLLIGVRENKPAQTLAVDPVLLDGLAETVDEIARSRCDPPLYVVCHPLTESPGGGGPARGVLLVEVPASPSAPHMTDGKYYGRGDTTNHRLTDGEVARLHALRAARQVTAEEVIAAEIARDPVPAEHRRLSHLHVVAQPLASPPDLLSSLIGTPSLSNLVTAVPNDIPPVGDWPPPTWQYLTNHNEPRAEGSGFHSYGLSGRQFLAELQDAEEGALLDVEVHDNGRVSLFCGRASLEHGEQQHVIELTVTVLTRALVTLAGRLAADTGYGGRWLLAVGVDDLSGKTSSAALNSGYLIRGYPPFSANSYAQGTEAPTVELLERPAAVTRRLVRRLLRALGSGGDQSYEQLL